MKKTMCLLVVLCSLLATNLLNAQSQKYAHVNSQVLLQSMPGADSIDVKLRAFQAQLQSIYEELTTEFKTKQEKYQSEAATMSSSVRQIKEKELMDLQNRIQEFQYGVQEDLEEEQLKLVKPFQEKIQAAIDAVAKEHGFAYIFDTQVLLYSEGGTDATPLIKQKLGIK